MHLKTKLAFKQSHIMPSFEQMAKALFFQIQKINFHLSDCWRIVMLAASYAAILGLNLASVDF